MALLDRDRNVIVIRVVYDGPPEAGKTSSLRALAGSLGQTLYSPAEQNGRTLFFDWMDYTGGRFEGFQIRCQITSVPGQAELHARRAQLLVNADVVVYVADTTRPKLEATLDQLVRLPALVADVPPPTLGVILQANKRDLPDAVPLDELRAKLQGDGLKLAIIESVAAEGTGIRETFVFAVRLALDRVREQLRTQSLPSGQPEIETGEVLYERMRAAEGPTHPCYAKRSLRRRCCRFCRRMKRGRTSAISHHGVLGKRPWRSTETAAPHCPTPRPRAARSGRPSRVA